MDIIVQGKSVSSGKIGKKILMPCHAYLPPSELEGFCHEAEYVWRQRVWGPLETFWCCVIKHLDGVVSARALEHHLGSLQELSSKAKRDGLDFCRARKRLPKEVFEKALHFIGLHRPFNAAAGAFGLRVVLVDGFTSKVPDTRPNREYFGRSVTRHGQSRLPIVRTIVAVCGSCGSVLLSACGRYRDSEQTLFKNLLVGLHKGMLVVGDRHFCSFPILWSLLNKGAHGLFRQHQTRKGHPYKSLGYKDKLMRWPRKGVRFLRCAAWNDLVQKVKDDLYVRHIERVVVRKGYRSFTLKLCTTLIDPEKYPAHKLVKLYLQRWNIEGDIRIMKSHHGLRRLTGKSPDIIEKELLSALLAYSLICILKEETGQDPRRVSCLQASRLLRTFSERMVEAPPTRQKTLSAHLIREIQMADVPIQERPHEPRILVAKPTRFRMFRVSRGDWKKWYKKQIS